MSAPKLCPPNPRLIGIAGPLEGVVLSLSGNELSIGRDASNQIPIDHPSVAAQHCRIYRRTEQELEIQDMSSCGATVVNGLPVTERILMHGDEIFLGDCRFLYLQWDAGTPLSVGVKDGPFCTEPARQDCPYRASAASLKGAASGSRMVCSLTAMLKIGAGIQLARGTQEIAQQLLEGVFEALPAQHGGVLLFEGQSQEPFFAAYRDRETGPATAVRTYRAIIERVRRNVTSVLATDVLPDRDSAAADGDRPCHVLAAPIVTSARTLGVIYLDSSVPGVPFRDDHLKLTSSVGAILGLALDNALRLERLETENLRLQEAIGLDHGMVGASPRMREVYQFVSKVAPTNSTVLVRGESGTGKELVACAIHRNSSRANMPFLAINCAGLSEYLLESELFGHEKGAFTGAFAQKLGKLELADRGTVFLDEVGEMPLACQAMLLRVLEERKFERLGGVRPISSDIRLIAATNRDLAGAIERGTFRKDLYYRLNVVSVTMPPLRDRRGDIPLLASYFVSKHGKRARRKVTGISREALACLEAHDWPGNVRDLENAIERAVVLGTTEYVLAEDLPESVLESARPSTGPISGYHETVRREKIRVILAALDQADGSFTEAAKLLGIHPNYLHRLVRNLNIRSAIKNSANA